VEASELRGVVREAAGGDERAAARLFDDYYPRVFRYAQARLGRPAQAEDVAAETFARVLKEIGRFRWRGAGFEAWLFRIASNLVIDQVRSASREQTHQDPPSATEVQTDELPESSVLHGELAADLDSMLRRLAPDQREVLALRFGAGLEPAEIGRMMRKNANAVRQLQFRALERLRQMMDAPDAPSGKHTDG
jgi:RNA polymerase sigma-70 factor (ECF subfamily)